MMTRCRPALATAAVALFAAAVASAQDVLTSVSAVIKNRPELTTLAAAVEAAGLTATLEGAGPFTVFSPKNDAFSEDVVTALLKPENSDALTTLLLSHVVIGQNITATDIATGSVTEAENGAMETLQFSLENQQALVGFVNATGTPIDVTALDLMALNGVVHVIEDLLISDLVDIDAALGDELPPTILDYITQDPELSELLSALERTGLNDTLDVVDEDITYTVFAPINSAFAALGDAYTGLSDEEVLEVLQYHAAMPSFVLSQGSESETSLQGASWNITVTGDDSFVINGVVTVLESNILTANGVLIKIDMVLMPPTGDGELPNILDVFQAESDLQSLTTALGLSPELAAPLATDGPFTAFAPVDTAIAAALEDGTLNLQDPNVGSVLQYHLLSGRITSTDIADGLVLETTQGDSMTFSVAADGTVTINGGAATVIQVDLFASNGVVHKVDTVVTPPSLLDGGGGGGDAPVMAPVAAPIAVAAPTSGVVDTKSSTISAMFLLAAAIAVV